MFSHYLDKFRNLRTDKNRKTWTPLTTYRAPHKPFLLLSAIDLIAHIVPWSISYDDKPNNGLALCRLCHWSFDEGLMSVDQDYRVLISKLARSDRNNPGLVMTLEGRPIFKPVKEKYFPSQERLDWHRRERFRR